MITQWYLSNTWRLKIWKSTLLMSNDDGQKKDFSSYFRFSKVSLGNLTTLCFISCVHRGERYRDVRKLAMHAKTKTKLVLRLQLLTTTNSRESLHHSSWRNHELSYSVGLTLVIRLVGLARQCRVRRCSYGCQALPRPRLGIWSVQFMSTLLRTKTSRRLHYMFFAALCRFARRHNRPPPLRTPSLVVCINRSVLTHIGIVSKQSKNCLPRAIIERVLGLIVEHAVEAYMWHVPALTRSGIFHEMVFHRGTCSGC